MMKLSLVTVGAALLGLLAATPAMYGAADIASAPLCSGHVGPAISPSNSEAVSIHYFRPLARGPIRHRTMLCRSRPSPRRPHPPRPGPGPFPSRKP